MIQDCADVPIQPLSCGGAIRVLLQYRTQNEALNYEVAGFVQQVRMCLLPRTLI